MKKFGIIALMALCLAMVSCGGNGNDPDPGKTENASIVGQWQLTSVTTKANIGSEVIEVYLDFKDDGSFRIFQVIGAGRPHLFTGTYTYDKITLKGKYTDGTNIKPYDVTCTKSELKLTPQGGTEVDTYKSASIPADVIQSAVE